MKRPVIFIVCLLALTGIGALISQYPNTATLQSGDLFIVERPGVTNLNISAAQLPGALGLGSASTHDATDFATPSNLQASNTTYQTQFQATNTAVQSWLQSSNAAYQSTFAQRTNGMVNLTKKTGLNGSAATNTAADFIGELGTSDFGDNATYLWQSYGLNPGQWSQTFSFDFSRPAQWGGLNRMPTNRDSGNWAFWVNGNSVDQISTNVNLLSDVALALYNANLVKYSQLGFFGFKTNSVSGGSKTDSANVMGVGVGNQNAIEAFAGVAFTVVDAQPYTIAQTAFVGTNGIIAEASTNLDSRPDHQVTTWDFLNHKIHFGHLTNGVYSFTNPAWIDAAVMDYQKDTFTVRSNVGAQAIYGTNGVFSGSVPVLTGTSNLDATKLSGTVPPANLGSGSGGSTKFLREDSTWQTVSSGTSAHYFDVVNFGAVGDGITDDRAAFQSCFNACSNAGGGTVYVPHSSYGYNLSNATYQITWPMTLVGDGPSSDNFGYANTNTLPPSGTRILTCNSNQSLFIFRTNVGTVRDIAFEDTQTNYPVLKSGAFICASNSVICIQTIDVIHCTFFGNFNQVEQHSGALWHINDCQFYSPSNYCVWIRNVVAPDAGDWTMMGNTFISRIHPGWIAVFQESSGGGKVVANKFNANFAVGYCVRPSGTTSDIIFNDNSVENCSFGLLTQTNGSGNTIANATITGNQFAIIGISSIALTHDVGAPATITGNIFSNGHAKDIFFSSFHGARLSGNYDSTDGTNVVDTVGSASSSSLWDTPSSSFSF